MKIFLDSGDPEETKEALEILDVIEGQTTNPSLVAKNPEIQRLVKEGHVFGEQEIYERYKLIVQEISALLPNGSISVEVYADMHTTAEQMFAQAKEMHTWIPNAHIKLPAIKEGLRAAAMATEVGIKVNMTLCFTQEQAAAVYAATVGGKDTFVSPFIGRLDDLGENGVSLLRNIAKMYEDGDGHVKILAASIRSLDHFLWAKKMDIDIVTCPLKILKEWHAAGKPEPREDFVYDTTDMLEIPYKEINLHQSWDSFVYKHELIEKGVVKFVADWNKLLGK